MSIPKGNLQTISMVIFFLKNPEVNSEIKDLFWSFDKISASKIDGTLHPNFHYFLTYFWISQRRMFYNETQKHNWNCAFSIRTKKYKYSIKLTLM